jgi:hypothetical protein
VGSRVDDIDYYIYSRYGKRYELPLLFQSMIMIVTMLGMMHLCVRVKADKVTIARTIGMTSHFLATSLAG